MTTSQGSPRKTQASWAATEWTRRIRHSTFIRHNAIFFMGSLVVGLLNYLYYPVLGRLMEPIPFGETQTLVSLFLQLTTFLTVLGLLAVNIIVNYDDSRVGNRIVMELEKLALVVSVVLLLLTVIFGSFLREYFRFGSAAPFTILALTVVTTVPWTFRSAYLRAKQYFGRYSFANASSSALKLITSPALVIIGLGTSGAIFGIALSQIYASGYVAYYAHKYGFMESLFRRVDAPTKSRYIPDFKMIRPELKYAGLVLVGSLAITVLYSVDILVVKHYFDARTAGLYASIATVSRILFFITASVSQVMLPAVKLRNESTYNLRILCKSFALVGLIGGGTLVVFGLAPLTIVEILMGRTYLPYAHLLPRLSLAIFIISIANLLLTYFMALRRYAAGVIAIAGTLVTYLLLVLRHETLETVVNDLLIGGITLMVLLGFWLIWDNRRIWIRVKA